MVRRRSRRVAGLDHTVLHGTTVVESTAGYRVLTGSRAQPRTLDVLPLLEFS
jgi:hypothetical protein